MFNSLSHKGNANRNYTKIPSLPSKNVSHQENKQQTLVRIWRCVRGGAYSHTLLVGMQIGATTMEISMEFSQKTKNRPTL
jgi:hypothetical protein